MGDLMEDHLLDLVVGQVGHQVARAGDRLVGIVAASQASTSMVESKGPRPAEMMLHQIRTKN